MVNCQGICAGTAGCMFFTFDSGTAICTLTQDCDTIDSSCSTCTNGAAVMFEVVQSGRSGCRTGNEEKLSNSQICCLAQLCLAAA